MPPNVGYIGFDHHHRDPYFAIASGLGVDVAALCEPGRTIDPANVAAMDERPDEITTEGYDIASLVADATVYEDPVELLGDGDVDIAWITYRNDETPAIIDAAGLLAHVLENRKSAHRKPIRRTTPRLLHLSARAISRSEQE